MAKPAFGKTCLDGIDWPTDQPKKDWNFVTFGQTKAPPPPPPPLKSEEQTFKIDGVPVKVGEIREKMYTAAATKRSVPMALHNGGFSFQK